MQLPTSTISKRFSPASNGFALVATISVMVLLVMVALAMLSLSAVEIRSNIHQNAQSEARANARMALMLAIGELQKAAGPDQRITVSSSVLDTQPDTPEIDGLAHNHMLMVYDSWDTQLHQNKYLRDEKGEPTSDTISIQDTYNTPGRHPDLFRRYLISHEDDSALRQLHAAIDPGVLDMDDSNSVVLVRPMPKSHPNHLENNNLRGGLVSVNTSSNNKYSGKYAWAVVGKNLPSINTYEEPSDLAGLAPDANESQSPDKYSINNSINGLSISEDPDTIKKLISLNSLDIPAKTNQSGRSHFFQLSAESGYSILTDVKNGGLKKDFNLFMESDWGAFTHSDDTHKDYKVSNLQDAVVETPLCGIDVVKDLSPANPNIPPTSWRQLRDYYRLYRDSLNFNSSSVQWPENSTPTIDYFLAGEPDDIGYSHHNQYKTPDTLGYHRSPVIARFAYVIGLSSEAVENSNPQRLKLYTHVSPVLVLWNPYNLQLRIPEGQPVPGANPPYSEYSIQASFARSVLLETKIKTGDGPGSWIETFKTKKGMGDALENESSTWDDVILTNGGIGDSNDVVFKPGEVRIFSMKATAATGGKVHFVPGFDNNVMLDNRLKSHLMDIPKNKLSSTEFALRFTVLTESGLWTGNHDPEIPRAYGANASYFGIENFGGITTTDGDGKSSASHHSPRGPSGGLLMNWFSNPGTEIIKDSPSESARFPAPGSPPTPAALIGVSLKGIEPYPNTNSSDPVANRTWIHANPTQKWNHLFKPNDLKRSAFPYEVMHISAPGNGVAQYLQSDGNNAFIGSSITAAGTKHFTYQEIPISPVTNLAGLSGMRLTHGRPLKVSYPSTPGALEHGGTFGPNTQHIAHWGAAFGCGIGNSFAHPMIPGNDIYKKHSGFTNLANKPVFADHYDTLLLANDALYDSWFCSSVAPQTAPAYSSQKSSEKVIEEFAENQSSLPNKRLKRNPLTSPDDLVDTLDLKNGYQKIASHLLVHAGFNVNNPYPETWKALLHGIKNRQVPYIDAETGSIGLSESDKGLALSRFSIANSNQEGRDETDQASWTGIRYLTDEQIDKLATEIARQVKLRGPFLNMSEFINRRLSEDKFGICGPLQAAIDFDDFDNNFNGSPSSSDKSVNSHLKTDIITPNNNLGYEFPLAAKGSAYTGITGYVMQSDILKALGNTLTVRDDTFVIRAYGDSRNAKGDVIARAWCEATVQRTPSYLEPDNDDNSSEKPAYIKNGGNKPTPGSLSETNRKFGRAFNVTSFRWLSEQEIK